MTEKEWLACDNPVPMLQFLRGIEREIGRRLRLFAVGCCRILLGKKRCPLDAERLVDVAERYADGAATVAELEAAPRFWSKLPVDCAFNNASETEAGIGMADAAAGNAAWAATQVGTIMADDNGVSAARFAAEEALQSDLLRCIFGNPFYPVAINSGWLAWNDGTVRRIAQSIYDERGFDRMPILADALIDAGCDNADILNHCRSAEPHVRGCWVVDLLLGKE